MVNPDHLEIVRQGRDAIRDWREQHPDCRLDLVDAPLAEADLSGVDLRGADFTRAMLEGAVLRRADLRGANFTRARLRGANLWQANLETAVLDRADLRNADLYGADVRGARLQHAQLAEADLRFTKNLRLDGQCISKASFAPDARDPWSTVRRDYTGARMIFNLVFLLCFLAPYMFRAAKWSVVAAVEQNVQLVWEAAASSRTVPDGDLEDAVDDKGGSEVGIAEGVHRKQPPLRWTTEPLGVLLLGWDGGIIYGITGILLVLYNLFRALLTWRLSRLRETEERSGYAPRWKDYGWCSWLHSYFMRGAFWLAVASFCFHMYKWMGTPIHIPSPGF